MIAIYPGSFDPVTYGHLDVIKRTSKIADKLIVGLLVNNYKKPVFTIEERLRQLQYLIERENKNIEIKSFSGLLIDFAKENKANIIIRGLRFGMSEHDMQAAMGNKLFAPEVETLFMPAKSEYMYLSSSIVKEIAINGGDVSGMMPPEFIEDLKKKLT